MSLVNGRTVTGGRVDLGSCRSMASAGRRSLVAAGLTRARLALRSRLVQRVRVSDGEYVHVFRCEDPLEVTRAVTLLEKEPGTIRFIRTEVRPGDVFYDIGANIGLYTLAAGRRVGDDGTVCAFEPHAANVMNLLRNVAENGLGGRVKVVSAALNDSSGFFPFDYRSAEPGSALSRLESEGATGEEFAPVFSELKYATSVDAAGRGRRDPTGGPREARRRRQRAARPARDESAPLRRSTDRARSRSKSIPRPAGRSTS